SNYETLTKNNVQGAVKYLKAKGIYRQKVDIFRHFQASYTRGYEMLNNHLRRHRHNPEVEENRGRKPIIRSKKLKDA
ncbi:hypothetical protein K432DRAFT_298352, partial [Lepidopterella palustris CBS 459.81]